MLDGARDCLRNWWLIVRCSWLGSLLGAVPGIGGAVIDWLAYGHALRTEKDASRTFGKGDVRGVIASESANNAKEGGALIPTIAFGVPGSAGMAILLGAFLIHGLVPGPDMLTRNLDITYSMIWSIAIANILGAGLCYLLSGQFAILATLRYTLILPSVLSIVYIGAFQGTRDWGDLFTLLIFGVLGWTMKQARWPRAPLILGLLLGETVERYLFISVDRYELDWLTRPVVIALFAFSFLTIARPLLKDMREQNRVVSFLGSLGAPRFRTGDLVYAAVILVVGVMMAIASHWGISAKIVPLVVGGATLLFAGLGLVNRVFREHNMTAPADAASSGRIHMDVEADTAHLPVRTVLARAAVFFGWLVAFMLSMALVGLIPTVPLFVIAFMRLENRERWTLVLPQAIGLTIFIYVLFDELLATAWPATLLGSLLPALRFIPSV